MTNVVELKILISKVLLPRIRKLECELATLREYTWPYVEAQKEDMNLKDMGELMEFFKYVDDETILKLLRLKRKFSRNPGLFAREVDIVMNLRSKNS
jgi:hypothetical protein|tara:strand:- start:1402 stop:1692 length:291 start_codon:yes stop_codon:yes gene_type:complete